jgi:hypothetical protein
MYKPTTVRSTSRGPNHGQSDESIRQGYARQLRELEEEYLHRKSGLETELATAQEEYARLGAEIESDQEAHQTARDHAAAVLQDSIDLATNQLYQFEEDIAAIRSDLATAGEQYILRVEELLRERDDALSRSKSRTQRMVEGGRANKYRRRRRPHRRLIGFIVGLALLVIGIFAAVAFWPRATWPSQVTTMQKEIPKACQGNVASAPNGVNFACNPTNWQILWVFALETSGGNPSYGDPATFGMGLEPVDPSHVGGYVRQLMGSSFGYNPVDPTQNLQVAARAINNIVGGAVVTVQGKQVVQPGLMSIGANCKAYTGSAQVSTPTGGTAPAICSLPITTVQGQGALVNDIWKRWASIIYGKQSKAAQVTPQGARNVAVLFSNAADPGNPSVVKVLQLLRQEGILH